MLTALQMQTSPEPMSVNKVILIGRLGQNPELRYTQGGTSVSNFSLATNENWTDKSGQRQERTEWHRVVAWGKTAELCSQYLTKGRQVYLEGKLQTRQWEDQNGQKRYTTEIQATSVQFLGGRDAASAPGPSDAPVDQAQQPAGPEFEASAPNFSSGQNSQPAFTEDDIPF